MAVVLHAFVGVALSKLSALLEEKACMILEVGDDLKKILRRLERLKIFLKDAESKSIHDPSIRRWLGELKDFMYDADDVIDLCRIEGTKLLKGDQPSTSTHPVRSCFPLMSCFSATKFRYEIAEEIKSLNEKLKEIEENKPIRLEVITTVRSHSINRRQTSPEMAESDYVGVGIKEATQSLVNSLIEESDHKTKCRVWGIVGMGGIGKTTLSSRIYNNPSIISHFTVRIWVCVSQTFSETEILKEIIRQAGGVCGEASSKAELHSLLISSLSSKFLIVLDDLWSTDIWEDSLRSPLEKCGAPSGRIVVTTRDIAIVNKMRAYIHNVEKMNNHDGWTLLCKKVFGDDGEEGEMLSLEDIGIQIVDKCDGLPLAIKAIAGVLTSNGVSREEWEKLLRSHAWSMNQLPEELRGALYLSYDDLCSDLKQCFLYFTLYLEDSVINSSDLIRYWVAEGFISQDGEDAIMEDTAKDHYHELIRRNLLQPDPLYPDNSRCRMHDLLRSLGQLLVGEENICTDNDAATRRLQNANSLRSIRRLSIQHTKDTTFTADILRENTRCLRTLHLNKILPSNILTMFENNDLLKKFAHLRVLDLAASGIKTLPDSIGTLVHLRYLDLNCTNISMLPDSIENLVNLQALCLKQCMNLHYLPKGITKLCSLRCMTVDFTPLAYLPKGLDQLKQLNRLMGFFVANVDNSTEQCKMEELQPLTQLRELSIVKLERVNTGNSILTSKHYLKNLYMSFSLASETGYQYSEMEIKRIEKVMEELFPPPSLQQLTLFQYPGCRFPSWMSLHTSFYRLKTVHLVDCDSCTQLPPLGKLPQLKLLRIRANSIVTLGPENLFALNQTGEATFPKLEILLLHKMENWEEWVLGDDESISNGKLLPCLKLLEIINCLKLRSLPEGLQHATKLEKLFINGACCIQEIKNLPFLSKSLQVLDCPRLQEIHHLPLLRRLIIEDCPQLTYAADLNSLYILRLSLHPTAERLPDWLSEFSLELHQRMPRRDFQFELNCTAIQLQRCRKGGEEWPIIKRFPQVNIFCKGESLAYNNGET